MLSNVYGGFPPGANKLPVQVGNVSGVSMLLGQLSVKGEESNVSLQNLQTTQIALIVPIDGSSNPLLLSTIWPSFQARRKFGNSCAWPAERWKTVRTDKQMLTLNVLIVSSPLIHCHLDRTRLMVRVKSSKINVIKYTPEETRTPESEFPSQNNSCRPIS